MGIIIQGVEFPDKEVLVTPFELMRIAAGSPHAFRTSDGEDITVRLYSADEFMDAVAAAREGIPGADGLPPMTHAEAERLTAPLDI